MRLPRIATLAVLGLSLTSGLASADPVLDTNSQWTTIYYYSDVNMTHVTGIHYQTCSGADYWDGVPGVYDQVFWGYC
jgi:hypothetical protein